MLEVSAVAGSATLPLKVKHICPRFATCSKRILVQVLLVVIFMSYSALSADGISHSELTPAHTTGGHFHSGQVASRKLLPRMTTCTLTQGKEHCTGKLSLITVCFPSLFNITS